MNGINSIPSRAAPTSSGNPELPRAGGRNHGTRVRRRTVTTAHGYDARGHVLGVGPVAVQACDPIHAQRGDRSKRGDGRCQIYSTTTIRTAGLDMKSCV